MKKALVLTVLLMTVVSTFTLGQEALTYTEVVSAENNSKDELYNRAKIWFTTTYNSANDVLQMDDKEEGQIIGKAIITYNPTVFTGSDGTKGNIKYTIKIFVKDGRYKYEISNFIHSPYGSSSFGLITTDEESPIQIKGNTKKWSNKVWQDIRNQIESNMIPLVTSLKQGMTKKAETKDDDW